MSRVAKNIIYNIVGQGLVLVLGLLSVKYIYSRLGGDTVGIIYFAMMANAALCIVLELGICSTTVREVSAHLKEDPRYILAFIRTFSSFYWVLYLVFGVLMYWSAPFLVERWLNLEALDPSMALHALRVLLISSFLALPKSFYSSVIRGLQRMEISNVMDAAVVGIQQLTVILIILNGGGLIAVSYGIAAMNILGLAVLIAVCSRLLPFPRMLIPGYFPDVLKKNFRYLSQMTIISLTALAYLQADKIILSKILPVASFGYYYFAYSLVEKGALVTTAISNAIFPHLSHTFGTGGRSALEKEYSIMQDTLCFLTVPVFAAIAFAQVPLFSALFNESVADILRLPTLLLCIGFYLTGTLSIPNNYSFVLDRPQIVARQNLLALFLILPAVFLFIRMWGMVGASLSIILYGLFCYLVSIPRICRECLGIPLKEWYLHLIKIFSLVGLTYGTAHLILHWIDSFGVFSLLIAYGLATILWLTGSYYLMGDDLKRTVVRLFRLPRMAGPRAM